MLFFAFKSQGLLILHWPQKAGSSSSNEWTFWERNLGSGSIPLISVEVLSLPTKGESGREVFTKTKELAFGPVAGPKIFAPNQPEMQFWMLWVNIVNNHATFQPMKYYILFQWMLRCWWKMRLLVFVDPGGWRWFGPVFSHSEVTSHPPLGVTGNFRVTRPPPPPRVGQ